MSLFLDEPDANGPVVLIGSEDVPLSDVAFPESYDSSFFSEGDFGGVPWSIAPAFPALPADRWTTTAGRRATTPKPTTSVAPYLQMRTTSPVGSDMFKYRVRRVTDPATPVPGGYVTVADASGLWFIITGTPDIDPTWVADPTFPANVVLDLEVVDPNADVAFAGLWFVSFALTFGVDPVRQRQIAGSVRQRQIPGQVRQRQNAR